MNGVEGGEGGEPDVKHHTQHTHHSHHIPTLLFMLLFMLLFPFCTYSAYTQCVHTRLKCGVMKLTQVCVRLRWLPVIQVL
jgi:hypothetical protein